MIIWQSKAIYKSIRNLYRVADVSQGMDGWSQTSIIPTRCCGHAGSAGSRQRAVQSDQNTPGISASAASVHPRLQFSGPHMLEFRHFKNKSCLAQSNQYSIQGRLLRADLIQYWKLFHGKCSVNASDMFTSAPRPGTRGHRFKIGHTRSQTDVRCRSFSVRSVDRWNELPDHVVAEPSIDVFKVL